MTIPQLSRRALLAGATGVAVSGALSACSRPQPGSNTDGAATYSWDMTITIGNTSTWWAGAEAFQKALEEKSSGRMVLNLFANEQLSGGDPAAGIEMLQNNQKAFSYNSTIIYAGLDERFGAVNAPFLYTDLDDADSKLAKAAEAYKTLCDEMNIKMLGFAESGFRQVTNNIRPIQTPADLAGIKIRIPGITMFQDVFRELGANATTMNFSEVFTSLQQGTIDGQENPVEVTHSSGLTEVQKYMTNWNYIYDPLILGMSGDLCLKATPNACTTSGRSMKCCAAAPNERITYIDLYPHFTAPGTEKLDPRFTNDGLHLTGEGYLKWAELVKPYITPTEKK